MSLITMSYLGEKNHLCTKLRILKEEKSKFDIHINSVIVKQVQMIHLTSLGFTFCVYKKDTYK